MTLQIFTDGSYDHVNNRGAWAFCIYGDMAPIKNAGDVIDKRNKNVTAVEVVAIVKALQFIARTPDLYDDDIWVHTDCESIVDAVLNDYDGFPRTALHYEVIFIWLVRQLRVRFRWIPRGINDEADALAKHQMRYGFIENAEGSLNEHSKTN